MLEAVVILVSLALFVFNYTVNRDLFYPPALFCLVWSVIFISYSLYIVVNPSDVYIIDNRCLLVFLAGEIIFTVGGLFAVNRKTKNKTYYTTAAFNIPLDKYLFWILLLAMPVYLSTLMGVIGASSVKDANAYIILRYEFTNQEVDIGAIKYINTIVLFAFAVALYKFHFTGYVTDTWRKRLYKYLFYTLVIVYVILSTGRTYFLFISCIYLGFKVISKTIKRKHLIAVLVVFILVFAANSYILGKAGGERLSFVENMISVFNSINNYLLAGVYGLNSVFSSDFTLDHGQNTFRFFFALANSLGITKTPPKDLVLPYIPGPINSNVYTVYYSYIKDFWYAGIGIMMLWSYLHSWFYYRAGKSFFSLFMYAVLLYPLVMSFFQDQYMTLLSTWIQLIIMALLASGFILYSKDNGTAVPEKNG